MIAKKTTSNTTIRPNLSANLPTAKATTTMARPINHSKARRRDTCCVDIKQSSPRRLRRGRLLRPELRAHQGGDSLFDEDGRVEKTADFHDRLAVRVDHHVVGPEDDVKALVEAEQGLDHLRVDELDGEAIVVAVDVEAIVERNRLEAYARRTHRLFSKQPERASGRHGHLGYLESECADDVRERIGR